MNKKIKFFFSVLLIVSIAFSAAGALVNASYSQLPWASNQLTKLCDSYSNELNVASTVDLIGNEEIQTGNFVNYFDSLISSGTISSDPLNADGPHGGVNFMQVQTSPLILLAQDQGVVWADVAEMSNSPQPSEWATPDLSNMQQYAVGIDGVAIVVSPDMTWFPRDLTTLQVAQLFADNNPTANLEGNYNAPLYNTWGDFLMAYYNVSSLSDLPTSINGVNITNAITSGTIQRACPTPDLDEGNMGTFDCFNNYFAVPNGYHFEDKSGNPSSVDATMNMAGDIYNTALDHYGDQAVYLRVEQGNLITGDFIGVISLARLQAYGGPQNPVGAGTTMIGLNIVYNTAPPPATKTASPLTTYYGPSDTFGIPTSGANTGTNGQLINPSDRADNGGVYSVYSWGNYVAPTDDNLAYAFYGIKDSAATDPYEAWTYVWAVVPGAIPASGPTLAAGVWIAYMMADGTTNAGTPTTFASLAPGGPGTGNSNFVEDSGYVPLERDDIAGGPVLDSYLQPHTPLPTQTQSYPQGVVNFNDITYFVAAYINYNVNHVYNPYADQDANGVINFNDISLFVGNYIAYYSSTWEPQTYSNSGAQTAVVGENGSLGGYQDDLSQTASLNLDGPAVLPSVGSSFNVTLNVNDVSDLWGWGTGLTWNPSVLALTNITEGQFLPPAGSTLFLNSLGDTVEVSNGTLRDMGDVLWSSSGVSGSGNLATLTFKVLSNAPVNITLTGSELESPYTGSGIEQIPCTVNNNLQIQPLPTPTGTFAAVQQGTTNQYWSVGPTPNPINTTIGVDVRISGASNVWGWAMSSVTWNPRILQLTGVTEGSFLSR